MLNKTEQPGLVGFQVVILDTTEPSFSSEFDKYKHSILSIFSHSYRHYYGDDYLLTRIAAGESVLFLGAIDHTLVGASYVKRNLRRGGTAVYPDQYRGRGIAEALVKESLKRFPRQYTILSIEECAMLSLLEKAGFRRVLSSNEIKHIVKEEFVQLSEFTEMNGSLVFSRRSIKRAVVRPKLILLHTFDYEARF